MTTSLEAVWLGTVGSLVAGLGTALGALAVLAMSRLERRTEDALLSAAAGIMLAATFFSLLDPGIRYAEQQFASPALAVLAVIAGVLGGAYTLSAVHRHVPHEHFVLGREGPEPAHLKRIWLFVIAITLHNFPEGMAVGVGFAGDDVANGLSLASGIAVQNVPEGLAVAVSLRSIGYSRGAAFAVGSLTGLVEPVGGLVGALAVWLLQPLIPFTLGFAAGAMLFVISGEVIPETHRTTRTLATFSLLGGFALMMFLDTALG